MDRQEEAIQTSIRCMICQSKRKPRIDPNNPLNCYHSDDYNSFSLNANFESIYKTIITR